jgi:hypothetical protein
MAGLVGIGLYFLPSLIAAARQTHNAIGVFLLNLFLGWTGIGWILALIIAVCSSSWPSHYYCRHPYQYPPGYYDYPPPRRW